MKLRKRQKGKPKLLLKIIVAFLIFLGLIVAAAKIFNFEKFLYKTPQAVVNLITNTGLESDNGRVNVLLLGTGGENHEGPDLSDTMIIASIAQDASDVALISFPRDLWVPQLETKINALYAFGQEKNAQGLKLTKKTTSDLFGLPIHYAIRVDFTGFTKAVDLVGGLDIEVDNAFTDPKYPLAGREDDICGLQLETITNGTPQVYYRDATGSAQLVTKDNDPFTCRYETLSFAKGETHMDGETALKFVRSRLAPGDEGSDFARSTRQQKVIIAFRQKLLSSQTLTDPQAIANLAKTFGNSIDSDIEGEDTGLFINLGRKIDSSKIRRIVLDADYPESRLEVGDPQNHSGQYVLVPKNNSWQDLAEYIQGEVFTLEEK